LADSQVIPWPHLAGHPVKARPYQHSPRFI